MGFISLADQIFHTLPTTRHRCNLDVWALAPGTILQKLKTEKSEGSFF